MTINVDPDLAQTMTPQEREAMTASEFSPDDVEAMKRIADEGAPATTPEAKSAEASAPAAEAKPAEARPAEGKAPAEAAAPTAETKPAEAKPAEAAPTPQPTGVVYNVPAPEKVAEQTTALNVREEAAWTQFDNGDIDRAELQKELNAVGDERNALNAQKLKAEIAAELTTQNREATRRNVLLAALADYAKPEGGGINYLKDKQAMADLDQSWRVIAARPENAGRSDRELFDEAHRVVRALRANITPIAAGKSPTAAALDARKSTTNLPKTLAGVPGGAGPGDTESEFAELDKLSGEALEDAIAKMTPAQRERYELA